MEYGSRIKCGMTIMLALLSILRQFLYLWYPDEVLSQGLTQCFVTPSCSASSDPHEALRQRVMQCFVRMPSGGWLRAVPVRTACLSC